MPLVLWLPCIVEHYLPIIFVQMNHMFIYTAALVDYPDTLQSYLRLMSMVHFAFVVLYSYYNNSYPSFHLSTYSHILIWIVRWCKRVFVLLSKGPKYLPCTAPWYQWSATESLWYWWEQFDIRIHTQARYGALNLRPCNVYTHSIFCMICLVIYSSKWASTGMCILWQVLQDWKDQSNRLWNFPPRFSWAMCLWPRQLRRSAASSQTKEALWCSTYCRQLQGRPLVPTSRSSVKYWVLCAPTAPVTCPTG